MTLVLTLLGLATPLALGVLCGAVRLFAVPSQAIGALNRYVLYLAFPTLIVIGITDRSFTLPTGPAFYLLVPAVALTLAAVLAVVRQVRSLRPHAGTTALTSLFANIAYVGLPVVEGVLGPDALGLAALAVAIHVATAMVTGPALLLTWSGRGDGALMRSLQRVVRQPLFWAPIVGLVLRWVPGDSVAVMGRLLTPVGRSASPVALFLIGLFLHTHRRRLRVGMALVVQCISKLVVVPALTLGMTMVALQQGWLTHAEAAVLILLSAMPSAISTFSLAVEFDTAVDDVTVGIIGTTLLAAVAIPVAASMLP